MFASPLLLLPETFLDCTVMSPVGCFLLFLRAFWVWSFFWVILWIFWFGLRLPGRRLNFNFPSVMLNARESMAVDILSKAIFKNASFWPAHSGCISLAASLLEVFVKMCGALGFSTSSCRCFLLLNLHALLSSTPLSISPLCDGCIYFWPYKVSVMVLCYDRLFGLLNQQGWSFPVLGCLLTSSGYGLLNFPFHYDTCRGILVTSSTLLWLFGNVVWWLCIP